MQISCLGNKQNPTIDPKLNVWFFATKQFNGLVEIIGRLLIAINVFINKLTNIQIHFDICFWHNLTRLLPFGLSNVYIESYRSLIWNFKSIIALNKNDVWVEPQMHFRLNLFGSIAQSSGSEPLISFDKNVSII